MVLCPSWSLTHASDSPCCISSCTPRWADKTIVTSVRSFSDQVGTPLDATLGSSFVLLTIISFGALGVITGYLWSQYHFKRGSVSTGSKKHEVNIPGRFLWEKLY